MVEYTEDNVYKPAKKIAIAFSFEGVVNDGAPECGLTTFNAYRQLSKGRDIFGKSVEPDEFDTIKDREPFVAFMRMRPIVNKAFEYFFVIDAVEKKPDAARGVVADQFDKAAFDVLIDEFHRIAAGVPEEKRKEFDEAFYAERKRMQANDYFAWENIQRPFPDAIREMRYLTRTQVRDENQLVSGFVPYFATSKDEHSTYKLCVSYVKVRKLDPEDISEDGSVTCTIPRNRIIGKEAVPSREKTEQLRVIAGMDDIPHSQVWRVNDRYDAPEQQQLWDDGFHYQFLVPGYTFPHDFEKAETDGRIVVYRDMRGLAKKLGECAQKWGF